jgi:hypothetical protein
MAPEIGLLPATPLILGARPTDESLTSELSQYFAGTTQHHAFGRRLITNDGKVFHHSLSSGRCYTGRGNVFSRAIDDATGAGGIDYAVLAADAPLYSNFVKMTNTGSSPIAENALAGGQILMKPTETYTDAHLMMRTVVGNSFAAATSGICTIYLDAPIEIALTTSHYAFVMPSPYTDVSYDASSNGKSFAGIAATYIDVTGYYFWVQTWGACWVANQNAVGRTSLYRSVYWREDGSLDIHSSIGTNVTDQRAGVILDNNDSANGSTVIRLEMDI